jgi:pyruvate dehydrogenase E2 component (dihydrolipoamide acetyltransferase)
MIQEFKLPDLGEGVHEGEIVDVLVSVGDRVQEDQPVLTVETDKATVEIPSPCTGLVKEINVKPGETVKVGRVLMVFETAGAAAAKAPEETPPAPVEREAPERPSLRMAGGPAPTPGEPVREKGPTPASPATRRLARELGVDINSVKPSGPAGLVTAEDVRSFVRGREAASGAEAAREGREKEERAREAAGRVPERAEPLRAVALGAPGLSGFERWGPVEREPLRSVRKATARQMELSWSRIPHVNHQDEADITELEVFRKRRAPEVEARGGRLTLLPFALKAAAAALKKYPYFNCSLDEAASEIVLKRYYNIGVATDTERGLLVPVIRDVDRKSILDLAVELHELAQRTREGKASLEELQGGAFTVTNIGAIGGTAFSPIINYPEAAIMGMARARLRPVVRTEGGAQRVVVRLMLPLILAFDHRVADGADAARFLSMVAELLGDPEKLLLAI